MDVSCNGEGTLHQIVRHHNWVCGEDRVQYGTGESIRSM